MSIQKTIECLIRVSEKSIYELERTTSLGYSHYMYGTITGKLIAARDLLESLDMQVEADECRRLLNKAREVYFNV